MAEAFNDRVLTGSKTERYAAVALEADRDRRLSDHRRGGALRFAAHGLMSG